MLLHKTFNVSCNIIKLRPTNQVTNLTRKLSMLHNRERCNLSVYYVPKYQKTSPIWRQNIIRHQSSESTMTIINKSIDLDNENIGFPETAEVSSTNVVPGEELTWIPEAPEPIPIVEPVLNSAGEIPFTSIGLSHYTPVGFLQYCLEFLHIEAGLPWWGAIATGTLVIRTIIIPLVIKAQRNSSRMVIHGPEMQELTTKMTEARSEGNIYEAAKYGQELMRYTSENDIKVYRNFILPCIQAPIFLAFFMALRQMIHVPVESFREGGLWWFTDLTLMDPYYILPLVTSGTLALTIAIGVDGMNVAMLSTSMKYALRLMPIILFPFIMHFEAGILIYWVSTNFISLIQTSILKIPKVREHLNIVHIKLKPKSEQKKKQGFMKQFKSSYQNYKIARAMSDRDQFNETQFNDAGKGPLTKTFDYDPLAGPPIKSPTLAKKQDRT